MRVTTSIFSFLIAAGLASAAPMRIVVLSEPIQSISSSGHEIYANVVPVAGNNRAMRRPCNKNKGFSISEAFRKAFGMASPEEANFHATVIGPPTGVTFDRETYQGHTNGGDRIQVVGSHHGHQGPVPPAMMRLHRALMMLGPWEGRAVAFVLGCGLGVLLRIAYLAILLSYRFLTRQSTSGEQQEGELLVPPPAFILQHIDEKDRILFEDVPDYEHVTKQEQPEKL